MENNSDYVLVANQVSMELARKIADELGIEFTAMIRKEFADEEIYHAFPEDIDGKKLVIIASTPDQIGRAHV